jgi:hypothetical protein
MSEREDEPGLRPDPARVAEAYRALVTEWGAGELERLEERLTEKYARVRALGEGPELPSPGVLRGTLPTVVRSRTHLDPLIAANPPEVFRDLVRAARSGRLRPGELAASAGAFRGVPDGIARDLAAELIHGAAPDRYGLWSRWVWNPERGTGALAEFVPSPRIPFPSVQPLLGAIRLELGREGFRSATFAPVDILLAWRYAVRLEGTSREAFHSGGLESLLPGTKGITRFLLGIPGGSVLADR